MNKKLLVLLFMLFIPVSIFAKDTFDSNKVKITSITRDSKSETAEELTSPTFNDKTVNIDVRLHNVNDYITYKIIVKNDNSEKVELDTNSFVANSSYVEYTLSTSDNNKIINANSEKEITLKVTYKNQLPESSFTGGVINETKELTLNLKNESIDNPKTGVESPVRLLIIMLFAFSLLYFALRKNGYIKPTFIIILALVMIPTTLLAINKVELKANAKVQIVAPSFNKLYINGHEVLDLSSKDICQNSEENENIIFENYDTFKAYIGYVENSVFYGITLDMENGNNDSEPPTPMSKSSTNSSDKPSVMILIEDSSEILPQPINPEMLNLKVKNFTVSDNTTIIVNEKSGDEAIQEVISYIESFNESNIMPCEYAHVSDTNPEITY